MYKLYYIQLNPFTFLQRWHFKITNSESNQSYLNLIPRMKAQIALLGCISDIANVFNALKKNCGED